MAVLNLKLKQQLLELQNEEILASGGVKVDRCAFTFDETWEDYTCTGVFYQDKNSVQYAVLEKDNTCEIPPAARAKEGRMYVGVFGIKGSKILTSTLVFVDVNEGAISGQNVSTEPTDDVFLAIISQYQAIMDMVADQNLKLEEANEILKEQTELLEKLNVFEVDALESRMSAMEIKLGEYGEIIEEEHQAVNDKLQEIEDKFFIIRDVNVAFDENNQFRLDDERITSESVVNAYFGVIEVDYLLNNTIYVESFDGYVLFTAGTKIEETVVCTLEVRGY